MINTETNKDTMWKDIVNTEDINELLQVFSFHDSCLKELYLWTGHYVNPDLSMAVSGDLDYNVRIIFQQQSLNPSAIEMVFEEVTGLHINPSPENYDSIIYGASFLLIDGIFYWADDSDWNLEDRYSPHVSWISSLKVKWRDVSNWMGSELRYGKNLD